VQFSEGLAHGFLALHTLEGTLLASGDLTQRARGARVTVRLRLHFKDGSLHEETAVYSQANTFRFIRDHVVQRGPAFKTQLDSTIRQDGRVTVRSRKEGGEEQVTEERLKLPADLANGMMMVVLKNIRAGAGKTRLVQLEIEATGEDPFTTAGLPRKATHYVIKVRVPGVTGAIASILGKIPPDSHFWVLRGDEPAFVKGESTLAMDGPVWRIEMVAPTWPAPSEARK
jgi:hypothetical protein